MQFYVTLQIPCSSTTSECARDTANTIPFFLGNLFYFLIHSSGSFVVLLVGVVVVVVVVATATTPLLVVVALWLWLILNHRRIKCDIEYLFMGISEVYVCLCGMWYVPKHMITWERERGNSTRRPNRWEAGTLLSLHCHYISWIYKTVVLGLCCKTLYNVFYVHCVYVLCVFFSILPLLYRATEIFFTFV